MHCQSWGEAKTTKQNLNEQRQPRWRRRWRRSPAPSEKEELPACLLPPPLDGGLLLQKWPLGYCPMLDARLCSSTMPA